MVRFGGSRASGISVSVLVFWVLACEKRERLPSEIPGLHRNSTGAMGVIKS